MEMFFDHLGVGDIVCCKRLGGELNEPIAVWTIRTNKVHRADGPVGAKLRRAVWVEPRKQS